MSDYGNSREFRLETGYGRTATRTSSFPPFVCGLVGKHNARLFRPNNHIESTRANFELLSRPAGPRAERWDNKAIRDLEVPIPAKVAKAAKVTDRAKMSLRCTLGFHKRASRKACARDYAPRMFCERCRQPMEKNRDGDWRIKPSGGREGRKVS